MEKTKNFLNNQNYVNSENKHKKLFLGFFIGLFVFKNITNFILLFKESSSKNNFYLSIYVSIFFFTLVFLVGSLRANTIIIGTLIFFAFTVILFFFILSGRPDLLFKGILYPFLRFIYTLEYLFLGKKYITFQLKPTYKIITEAKEINIENVKNEFYEIIKK